MKRRQENKRKAVRKEKERKAKRNTHKHTKTKKSTLKQKCVDISFFDRKNPFFE